MPRQLGDGRGIGIETGNGIDFGVNADESVADLEVVARRVGPGRSIETKPVGLSREKR